MTRRLYLLLILALAVACGEIDDANTGPAGQAGSGAFGTQTHTRAVELAPEVQLIGLGDIYNALEITHLSFDAELFLLPEGDEQPASVSVRYVLDDDGALTHVLAHPLTVTSSGRYQLLVRIRPNVDDGISVRVSGAVDALLDPEALFDREKDTAGEPEPTLAEPTDEDGAAEPEPTLAEPEPTLADPNPAEEPEPTLAEPGPDEEPEPTLAEPSPADEPEPTLAQPAPEAGAPSADEPLADGARAKNEATVADQDARDTVFVRSSNAYEFYAGTVEVSDDASALVVTWDVRRWLRNMLAAPLGLEISAEPNPGLPELGFTHPGDDEFIIITQ
jgi:hypothetical protein